MRSSLLTTAALAALKPGEWAIEPAARGEGRLEARRLSNGTTSFYFRYANADGGRERVPLGTGTLKEARAQAGELRRRYQAGERDLRGALKAEAREVKREREVVLAAEAAARVRAEATLGALCEAYADDLTARGKDSAAKVRACFHRHVRDPWPRLWAKPVAEITPDDLLHPVARLAQSGYAREPDKLRSYLGSAFASGMKARLNARASEAQRALQVQANPAAILPTVGQGGTRERALELAELRAYWRRVQALPDPDRSLLAFHLLTGGQRIEQLSRLTMQDLSDGMITIRDGKGRRNKPRLHYVPLTPLAQQAMRAMRADALGPYLFTLTGGLSAANYGNVQSRIRKIANEMEAAGELVGPVFTPGDLRRTCETRLAAAKISKDDRAHLQSHGLGGLQDRVYDKYERGSEKLLALQTLERLITGKAGSVTLIRKGAR